jgi:fucose 4-O-acetylase-like acetyltransferase
MFLLSWGLDALPLRLYAVHDYWHTSPNFFFARVGAVLVVYWIGYAWCRWGRGQVGFSPLIELGQASLLVYWVHNEFVYGRLSILTRGAQGIPMATLGLLILVIAMVLLAMARRRSKGRGAEILAWFRGIRSDPVRGAPRPAAEG